MYTIELRKFSDLDHHFIKTTGKPVNGAITEAATLAIYQFLPGIHTSLKKWRKEKKTWNLNYEFPPGRKRISKPINYLVLSEHIRANNSFDPFLLALPDYNCHWMDDSTGMLMDFYVGDKTGELGIASGDLQKHHFGENYPIKPLLNREGRLYTTIQPQLIQRTIRKRTELIQNSNLSLTDDWIFDLRNLISDSISLLDIAFNQLYVKAEYDPLPGWKFDKEKLKERHGRRLNDKIGWVHLITGNNLNIEKERKSLDSLRELRNHFMHFDPPSLVITIEEAVIWLNQMIDIGKILIKMRQALGVAISYDLINYLLQEEAVFNPIENKNRNPVKEEKSKNYLSSTW